jgi:DNA mismatch endonuclease, patch repair protein
VLGAAAATSSQFEFRFVSLAPDVLNRTLVAMLPLLEEPSSYRRLSSGQGRSVAPSARTARLLRVRPRIRVSAMGDRVSKTVRSRIMASVGTRNTGPEVTLRKALHAHGFRYVTHSPSLSGRPDIVFPRLRKAIFVHGCFWHGHRCRWGKLPKTRVGYWTEKIVGNRQRDSRALRSLRREGWGVLVVWQCQIRNLHGTLPRVLKFLRQKPVREKR